MTVGTHEQQFNRLIKAVDDLKKDEAITEEVYIQTGYSDYEPKYCQFSKFVKYDEMRDYIRKARIVITHGGPASFLSVLEQHKSPIVVPRMATFDEHVNNHQLAFSKKIQELGYKIIVVDEIEQLGEAITSFQESTEGFSSNNTEFNSQLEDEIDRMLGAN